MIFLDAPSITTLPTPETSKSLLTAKVESIAYVPSLMMILPDPPLTKASSTALLMLETGADSEPSLSWLPVVAT